MPHTLKHPVGNHEVTVESDERRDAFISRGFTLVNSTDKAKPARGTAGKKAGA